MLKTALKNYVRNEKKMSILKISDPFKRDLIVKEYLETKKNIGDNLLSERTREQQLQTDLSKFYEPITKTQKATARKITEGRKPIREGIENLPQAITFQPTQPLGEASGKEEPLDFGEIAKAYLDTPPPRCDTTFGYVKKKVFFISVTSKLLSLITIIKDEKFEGTPGLWELIVSKNLDDNNYTYKDYENNKRLMLKTISLHRDNNLKSTYPKGSRGEKWLRLLSPIWYGGKKYEGDRVVVIPSDPNALLERLDLLLASKNAGHTGVRNELVSISDELKRQGVLDTRSYKKLNSIIEK